MNRPDELSTVPDEAIPRTELRRISLPIYGIHFFRDIFASRQLLSIVMRSRYTRKQTGGNRELNQMLTLWVGKVADLGNALCGWEPLAECPRHTLTRYDVPMAWDFAESVTWGRSSGSFSTIVSGTSRPLHRDGEGSRPADSRTGSSGTIVWRGRGRGRRRPPGETSHWSDSGLSARHGANRASRSPIQGHKRKSGANVSDDSLNRHRGATTFDHVHAAMLMQSAGRANALRALITSRDESVGRTSCGSPMLCRHLTRKEATKSGFSMRCYWLSRGSE